MAGYLKVYNIEKDPHVDLVVGGLLALKTIDEYLETLKKYPNPPRRISHSSKVVAINKGETKITLKPVACLQRKLGVPWLPVTLLIRANEFCIGQYVALHRPLDLRFRRAS